MNPLPYLWAVVSYVTSVIDNRQQREGSFDIRDGDDVRYTVCSLREVTVLRTTAARSESLIQMVVRIPTLEHKVSQGQLDSIFPECSAYSG